MGNLMKLLARVQSRSELKRPDRITCDITRKEDSWSIGLLGNHMMLAKPSKTLLWCAEATSHMWTAHKQVTTIRWYDNHTHSIHTTSHVLATAAIRRVLCPCTECSSSAPLATFSMILVDQPTYQGSVGPEYCSTDPAFLTHNLEYVLLKKLSYPCSNSCLLAF